MPNWNKGLDEEMRDAYNKGCKSKCIAVDDAVSHFA